MCPPGLRETRLRNPYQGVCSLAYSTVAVRQAPRRKNWRLPTGFTAAGAAHHAVNTMYRCFNPHRPPLPPACMFLYTPPLSAAGATQALRYEYVHTRYLVPGNIITILNAPRPPPACIFSWHSISSPSGLRPPQRRAPLRAALDTLRILSLVCEPCYG